MHAIWITSVLSVTLFSAADATAEADDWREHARPEQIELFDLIDSIFDQYEQNNEAAEKIQDPEEQSRFYSEQNPGHQFLPKLLAFEERHRGSDIGLIALGRIVSFAAGTGSIDDIWTTGRRQSLKRLHLYATNPLQLEVLRLLHYGALDPEVITFLRQQVANDKADPAVRAFSRYFLAEYLLAMREYREYAEQRLAELKAGSKPHFHREERHLKREFSLYPPQAVIEKYEAEALALLKSIAESHSPFREPAIKAIAPNRILFQVDQNPPQPGPLLTAKAGGLLFRESHLRAGKPAPELALKLFSGADWSLDQQRGRVTIIQFSSDNCVGCELMYPMLRELLAKHPEEVSVLTIMASEKPDECDKAVASGKITWNLYWDGRRGPVATRWNIPFYPVTYLIDGKGQIAATGVVLKDLDARVASLLNAGVTPKIE